MIDLLCGRAEDVLPTLEADSFDAIVTDPPAGIAFMGKDWDAFGARRNAQAERDRAAAHQGPGAGNGNQPFGYSGAPLPKAGDRGRFVAALAPIFSECLRVARPGAHALVWALPRTSHWTATALEDAGWLIEDRIAHHFGQGFPKHRSKLKPATEDWWLATKPGGAKWLGVDACRIAAPDGVPRFVERGEPSANCYGDGKNGCNRTGEVDRVTGRWPTNIVFTHHPMCVPCGERRVKGSKAPTPSATRPSGYAMGGDYEPVGYADPDGLETIPAWRCVEPGCPVAELDRQSGERKSGGKPGARYYGPRKAGSCYRDGLHGLTSPLISDSGGASRFFPVFSWSEADFLYCPKASRKDRGEGNFHPTVKPLALMRWLCRLGCPFGGRILDPFAGSGTTGVAAEAEGFDAVLVEQAEEYWPIILARIAAARSAYPLLAAPG